MEDHAGEAILTTLKKAAEGLVFNFIGRSAVVLLSFLVNMVIIRTLTVYEFGLYSYLLAVVTSVLVFGSAGINSALNRFVPELNAKQKYALAIKLIKKGFKVVLLVSTVALLFLLGYSGFAGDAITFYIRLCCPLIFVMLLANVCVGVLGGCFSQKLLNSLEISLTSAYLVLVLLISHAGLGLHGILIVLVILGVARLFSYLYSVAVFYKRKRKNSVEVTNPSQTYRRFWRYSKLSWIESGGDFILSMWPATFFLAMFQPMEEVG